MDIYLTKDGKSVGPFTADELRAKIKKGDADLDESAWSSETGDWKRLEQVLEHADSVVAVTPKRFGAPKTAPPESDKESKKKAKKRKKEKKAAEPERAKSTNLRPQGGGPPGVPSASGKKGKGPSAVRALPGVGSKGGKRGKGFAGLASLRWLALVAVLAFLFSIFLPWVTVVSDNGRSEMSAVDQVTAKASTVGLPGSGDAPKYFRTAKLILMGVAVAAILAGVLSFLGALNPQGSNWLGVLLALAAVAALVGFGYIQTNSMEGQFNRALQLTNIGDSPPTVEFKLDSGYFIGIGALLLLAGFMLVPQERSASPFPFFVLLALGIGAGVWGGKQMGSRGETILKDAFADMKDAGEVVKEKAEEGIEVIKEKIDKGKESAPDLDPSNLLDD